MQFHYMYAKLFTSTLTYTQAELHTPVKGYKRLVNKKPKTKPIAANVYVQITDEFHPV